MIFHFYQCESVKSPWSKIFFINLIISQGTMDKIFFKTKYIKHNLIILMFELIYYCNMQGWRRGSFVVHL